METDKDTTVTARRCVLMKRKCNKILRSVCFKHLQNRMWGRITFKYNEHWWLL